MTVVGLAVAALSCVVLLPQAAWAQQSASGIAGVVRDTSGAVLPGVTVEATSPALIEKVRVAVSDGEGRYNIVDLRPGTYAVRFTLPGFATFVREGIQLTAGFTATVNGQLQVGALEETITVTGEAPLVDTQNVRQQRVVSSDLLAELPSSSKALASTILTLVPGMSGTTDVGGSSGLYRSNGQSGGMLFHGKGDFTVLYDGMSAKSPSGAATPYILNTVTAQETTVETGGGSAQSMATLVMNLVPKEGGNQFSFTASGTGTNDSLQSDNLTDALRAQGLSATNEIIHFYNVDAALGGPMKQDRVWFFASARAAGNKNTVAGLHFNKTQGTPFYTPDLDRQAWRKEWMKGGSGRVTWQVSDKNKIGGFADFLSFFNRGRGEFQSPEANMSQYNLSPQGLFQVTWNSPRTSKFLLEAGWSFMEGRWPYPSPGDGDFRVKPTDISITELSSNFPYNAKPFYSRQTDQYLYAQRFSASYVTGTHSVKAGIQVEEGIQNQQQEIHGGVNYLFNRGVPSAVVQFATPWLRKSRFTAIGLFAQDSWTRNRLTLNYGLRFDYFNGYVPAQRLPATRFVPARDFDTVHGSPRLTDLSPRLGTSFDLFGNGRTALKMSLGRFVESNRISLTDANNPITTSVLSASRVWNDANGNYAPDCDLTNFSANGECGPISDQNFGKNNPRATRYADDVLRGFGNRNYSWDLSAEVQHELRTGVSVTAGYYRNWSGNQRVTDNLAVTPEDFDPFCITAPRDPRLPGGGGYQVCGLYDIKPAKFGRVENLVTQASHYIGKDNDNVTCSTPAAVSTYASVGRAGGANCATSDFFGFSFDTRFGSGIQLSGGVDTGRTVIDSCFVVDSPQQLLFCDAVLPFKAQTQVKALASIPLPGQFRVSATFQNVSGAPFEADFPVRNVDIAPSLGRDLAACGSRRGPACPVTATVPLVKPMTQFLDRRTQLDLRLSKIVRIGNARLRGNLDIYNVLNGSTVLGAIGTYGPNWLKPAGQQNLREVDAILPGRLIHFGGQVSF
jgi:hypothetical protein